MELYSIYCYSDEESEKETKVKISSLYGKVESYFALVKWIKIKGKPISIFPSVEKEIILNNNDRIFIKAYRTIIDTACLIISYLFTLLLLFF